MDFLTFVARIVEASAWPIAAVFVVWYLRGGLIGLIDRIRLLKWKDAEASFGQRLDQAEAEASATPAPTESKVRDIPLLAAEAELPPAYIVQQAWLRVEEALKKAQYGGRFIGNREGPLLVKQITALISDLGLSPKEAKNIHELRILRNEAVHHSGINLTPTDALRYRDLADRAISAIEDRTKKVLGRAEN